MKNQSSIPRSRFYPVFDAGGLDSMVLAAFADRHVPNTEPIDLITVAFAGDDDSAPGNEQKSAAASDTPARSTSKFVASEVPDRVTAINGLSELQRVAPKRVWRLVEVNYTLQVCCGALLRRFEHYSFLYLLLCAGVGAKQGSYSASPAPARHCHG
jgi:hypothetical protein